MVRTMVPIGPCDVAAPSLTGPPPCSVMPTDVLAESHPLACDSDLLTAGPPFRRRLALSRVVLLACPLRPTVSPVRLQVGSRRTYAV